MGLIHHQTLQDYWSTNPILCTPFFGSTMTRDRFLLLLSFLYFNDNRNYIPREQPGYDATYKLGPIYTSIINSFGNNYYPTKCLAIDEGIVPWRGNIHFRVYNPDKPYKFGLKSYQLCDDTSYCVQFELYVGKRSDTSQYGSTHDVCMRLMNRYLRRGHHLYMDNFHSSPTLFSHLYENGTGACGTLRVNRKHVPMDIKAAKPAKGESVVVSNGPLMINHQAS